jgi:hypothetical protein
MSPTRVVANAEFPYGRQVEEARRFLAVASVPKAPRYRPSSAPLSSSVPRRLRGWSLAASDAANDGAG